MAQILKDNYTRFVFQSAPRSDVDPRAAFYAGAYTVLQTLEKNAESEKQLSDIVDELYLEIKGAVGEQG